MGERRNGVRNGLVGGGEKHNGAFSGIIDGAGGTFSVCGCLIT